MGDCSEYSNLKHNEKVYKHKNIEKALMFVFYFSYLLLINICHVYQFQKKQ